MPVYNLIEDAAKAEIARSQIWQWLRSPQGVLDDGRKVTKELYHLLLGEELPRVKNLFGNAARHAGRYDEAARLYAVITTSDEYAEFLAPPGYDLLAHGVRARAQAFGPG